MLDIHKKRILLKHTAAIHSCSDLTHTQKILFNNLLFQAYKTISEDKYHVLSYDDIYRALGWNKGSKINDWLKEELTGLIKQAVKWNVFGKDKKQEWVASSCLADVRIKEGNVYFSFSKFLREVFSSPNLYAKIDLDAQKKLESKESLSLWEFLIEFLDTNNMSKNQTDWIDWEKLVLLLSGSGSSYLKNYGLFKLRVLKKAIDQINANTDLEISFLEKKEGRAVKYVSFNVKRDNLRKIKTTMNGIMESVTNDLDDEKSLILKDLQKYVCKKEAQHILLNYNLARLRNALNFCNHEIRKNGEKLNNPVAFFKKALEEGWVLPEVMQQRIAESNSGTCTSDEEDIRMEIESSDESEVIKSFRLHLFRLLGTGPYTSWIKGIRMSFDNNTLKLTASSQCNADWIEGRYRSVFREAADKSFKTNDLNIEYIVEKPSEYIFV